MCFLLPISYGLPLQAPPALSFLLFFFFKKKICCYFCLFFGGGGFHYLFISYRILILRILCPDEQSSGLGVVFHFFQVGFVCIVHTPYVKHMYV